MGDKIHSGIIKTAVISYFRFKRRWPCIDECWCGTNGISDVLVKLPGNKFCDVEIKVNKWDLWSGEAKKSKHKILKGPLNHYAANYYVLCVPTELIPEAIKWVKETNPAYGILEFHTAGWESIVENKSFAFLPDLVSSKKSMKLIKENNLSFQKRLEDSFTMRLSSAYTNLLQKNLTKRYLIRE